MIIKNGDCKLAVHLKWHRMAHAMSGDDVTDTAHSMPMTIANGVVAFARQRTAFSNNCSAQSESWRTEMYYQQAHLLGNVISANCS